MIPTTDPYLPDLFEVVSHPFWDHLEELLVREFDPELVFYFEEEVLLPEVCLIWGNENAKLWESDQYFYLFKDLAFSLLSEPAQILNPISTDNTRLKFRSSLCQPLHLFEDTRSILMLANPRTKEEFEADDLAILRRFLEISKPQSEKLRLERLARNYKRDMALMDNLSFIVDLGNDTDFQIHSLIQLLEDESHCEIIVFLLCLDPKDEVFFLEAGNSAGRLFWDGQSEFLQSLARRAVKEGCFSESYGGKHFKGEKFGLDQLETSMIFPIEVYNKAQGAFLLLNKQGRRSFTKRDVRIVRMVGSLMKTALSRDQERKYMTSVFNRFVSEGVGQQILQSEGAEGMLEERRPVSVLFIDLNGFTSFSENSDPQVVTYQLNQYFHEMTNLITEFEGTLDKYLGDGIMAIFGSPYQIANHAERSVECALAMQKKMAEVSANWDKEGLTPLTASIGICTGDALVGTVGCDKLLDYTAIGDTINVASRLTQSAKSKMILIGESTWEPIQDVVRFQAFKGFRLKGKQQITKSYEILGLKSTEEVHQLLHAGNEKVTMRVLEAVRNLEAYKHYDGFLSLLDTSAPEVRTNIIKTIGKKNQDSHIPILVQKLQEDHEMGDLILQVLGEMTPNPLKPMLDTILRGLAPDMREIVFSSTLDSSRKDERRLFLALLRGFHDPQDAQGTMVAELTEIVYQSKDGCILERLLETLPKARPSLKKAILWAIGKMEVPRAYVTSAEILAGESDLESHRILARSLVSFTQKQLFPILNHLFFGFHWWEDWRQVLELMVEPKQQEPLRKLLNHESSLLRYVATVHLELYGSHGFQEDLLNLFRNSEEVFIQSQVIDSLKDGSNEGVIPTFRDLFKSRKGLQSKILNEFAFRKAESCLDLIHESLNSRDRTIKLAAIKAAGELGNQESLDLLLKELDHHDDANLLATVIQALGSFESDQVTPFLIKVLHSPVARIRANAVEGLMNCNSIGAVKAIERLLHDDNNRVRANAALACFRLGHSGGLSVLTQMTKSPNKWMRLSALWALNSTRTSEAMDLIHASLNDPDYDVILAAAQYLSDVKTGT
jgi:class 3 adenylate cyclase/HEAT repeat protein